MTIRKTVAHVVTLAAACAAAALCSVSNGAEVGGADSPRPDAAAGADEIVVTGRIGELRRELRVAEEAAFARFNDINSNDKFDIHCYAVAPLGTRISQDYCVSNSWREQDANIGEALTRQLQGIGDLPPAPYLAEQAAMQHKLAAEVRRLVAEDEQLSEAIVRVGRAQLALTQLAGGRPNQAFESQVLAGKDELPFDAQAIYQVRINRDAWEHRLAQRSFTIANVMGAIRKIDVKCDQGTQRITYRAGVDWTLPENWDACTLHVGAKHDTTFVMFEFAPPAEPAPNT